MCGIAGILDASAPGGLGELARSMAERLAHRGPDGAGLWADESAGIALGHRRLAIIDLSEAGHQPMISSCGRMVLSYNGEVYNTFELRTELKARGRRFRGHSDTEVIVEGAAEWGLAALLPRLIGMFAFALWDREARRLTLVRDRFGIKPLYWSHAGGRLTFGSELKALAADPAFDRTIDPDAVAAFLRFSYIPAPRSIYRAAHKLAPGHLLEFVPGAGPVARPWWRLADVVRAARGHPFIGDEAEAAEALDALLRDAVGRRMVADVPLGAFLSGGVDSSTVAALMQVQSDRPVKTFTIGFDVPGYDEARRAKAVARHLGTEHHELVLTPAEAMAVIPRLPAIYDEPFADASQIPTLLVCEMTRRHVTVALSGDGGDEIFAGYNRHVAAAGRLRRLLAWPRPLRRAMAAGIGAVPAPLWSRLAPGTPLVAEKARKLADVLAAGEEGFYRSLVSVWQNPGEVVARAEASWGEGWHEAWEEAAALLPEPVERMQFLDALTYLADDILTKVDRASMAVSLEARVPLLDHRVAAFAWSLPLAMKVRAGQGKRILRRVLHRYVPEVLVERPKQGFAVPLGEWLRAPLREWAGDLLSPAALARRGLVSPAAAGALWSEHLSGRRDHAHRLWALLTLQAYAG